MEFTTSGVRLLLIPVLAVSLIPHPQPHTAHAPFVWPTMVGRSAEVISVTATASHTIFSTWR
jgi:hypothetical protein